MGNEPERNKESGKEPGDVSGNEHKHKDDKTSKNNNSLQGFGYLTQLGVTMVASVIIGVLIGKFLDELLGTSPWLLLIFSLLGAGAAIKNIFNMSKD